MYRNIKKYSQPFTPSLHNSYTNPHHSPLSPSSFLQNICSCVVCAMCDVRVFPLHSTFLLFSASFISCCYSLVKIRGLRHPFIIMFIFRWKKQNFHDDIVAFVLTKKPSDFILFKPPPNKNLCVCVCGERQNRPYTCLYVYVCVRVQNNINIVAK